jgi:type 1 glutamine amidotransferase
VKPFALRCVAASTIALALLSIAAQNSNPAPIKLLIITGDHGHDWKATTGYFKEFLPKERIRVDVTETPAKDLTPDNLKQYDVLLLNYRDTPKGAKESPDTVWSPENKQAFLGAVRGGKGLVVYHHAAAAFLEWLEFERCIAGGWRGQGYHGPKHQFAVNIVPAGTNARTGRAEPPHPIVDRMPATFMHTVDELYANPVMFPENEVLVTAYSDPAKEYGTGKNEPLVWVKHYGRGRVVVNSMGHDVDAMKGPGFQTLMIRGIEWAATGKVTYAVPKQLDAPKVPAAN